MGLKHFFYEIKAKISHHRLFKGLITDAEKVLPHCMPHAIKSVEILEGNAIAPGCITKTTFADGTAFKYRIDDFDLTNHTCKYTLIEGALLGNKIEKITYDAKFEATPDGGCVVKFKAEYHGKGSADEISDELIEAGKQQAIEIYKACEEYLAAHPDVCA